MPASASALRTQPMIGLPSGLGAGAVESVRQLAAAGDHAEDFRTARVRGLEAFQHQRAGAFRHHESVAVLRKGLDAACGGSLWVEAPTAARTGPRLPALTEPSVATHSAASVSPRRIASTPSWIAVAPDAQAVDSEIGEPLVPNVSARWSATEPNMKRSVILREPVRRR